MAVGALDPRQVARGVRRIVYGWKGGPPGLPDFMRLCRTVGDEFDEGPVAQPPRIAVEAPTMDNWEIAANRHLLAHIIARRGKFTEHQVRELVTAKKSWASDMRELASNGPVPVDTQRSIWNEYVDGISV